MTTNNLYRTKAVAEQAGISKETLLRWMKERKVKEPGRDRNGWRVFTEDEVLAIVAFANAVSPSPHDRQRTINYK
jgi:DNA-binding transcriptional MerR regulator